MKTAGTSCLVLALLAAAGRGDSPKDKGVDKKPKRKFTIGKETTYVTGPLDKEGYVDYAAALNKRLSKGITPANNACVLIWKALGPHPEGANMSPEFFKWLGIAEPPEKGDYFIDLTRYAREQRKIASYEAALSWAEQAFPASQRPWTAKQKPSLASWLKANEKPLALVIESSKRSQYFSPLTPRRSKKGTKGLINSLMPAVQKCRELGVALTARAMLRVGQGDSDGAWQDLLACHRLGRLVARGGTIVEGFVGLAIDQIACQADLAFLDRAKPQAKRLQKCLQDLRALPPLPGLAEKVAWGERFIVLEGLLLIERHGTDDPPLVGAGKPDKGKHSTPEDIDWDPALHYFNLCCDRLTAALCKTDSVLRQKELVAICSEADAAISKAREAKTKLRLVLGGRQAARLRGELLGIIAAGLNASTVCRANQSFEHGCQIADNVVVAFALAWYQSDQGRYPEKLEALMPKYLAKLPQDRFTGAALIYRPARKGYLFYSVGVDGRDNDGHTNKDDPPGDDLPVRMPLPEPRK
jgi:hypothetical protein